MLEAIKKISRQTDEQGKPAGIMFGVVQTVGPVSVMVDNRFLIGEGALIIPRELRGGPCATHTHTIPAHQTEAGGDPPHGHGVVRQTTETPTEIYYGLQPGEKVILIRNRGGQEYLVVGRV